MLFKALFYLLVVLILKSTNCFKIDPNETADKRIVVKGSHIEIRIVDNKEEINRLKDYVKKLKKSSELLALKKMNVTINSLKAQVHNFSTYGRIIKSLQDQVNLLMMTSLVFPRSGTNTYVMLRNVITKDLVSVTVCFWMKTTDSSNDGTPFSYSRIADNELLIHNYKQFDFYIHGDSRQGSFSANDGRWHHICGTWQSNDGSWALYKDGTVKAQGKGFQTGSKIRGGGVLVLGQEQDKEGGGFAASQAFVGRMTGVDVWSRVLQSQEISRMSGSCGLGEGDVIRWSDVRGRNRHNVGLEILPECT